MIVGLLVLGGCSGAEDEPSGAGTAGEFPMTVQDCGRPVTIEERPQRVLTMGVDLATAVVTAGAADTIIGRGDEVGSPLGPYKAEPACVPEISPQGDLSREVIIGQQSDLVLSYGLNLTTPEDLAAVGIASIVPVWRCDGSGSGPSHGPVTFPSGRSRSAPRPRRSWPPRVRGERCGNRRKLLS